MYRMCSSLAEMPCSVILNRDLSMNFWQWGLSNHHLMSQLQVSSNKYIYSLEDLYFEIIWINKLPISKGCYEQCTFFILMSLIYIGKPLVSWYILSSSYMILYFVFTSLEKMFSKSIFGTIYITCICKCMTFLKVFVRIIKINLFW